MRKIILMINHPLQDTQVEELETKFNVDQFIRLSEDLKETWQQIPPGTDLPTKKLNEITRWILSQTAPKDYLLIQGEFGATFYLATFALKNNLIPLYATTDRVYQEVIKEDGTVERKHIFKHIAFRQYLPWNA